MCAAAVVIGMFERGHVDWTSLHGMLCRRTLVDSLLILRGALPLLSIEED